MGKKRDFLQAHGKKANHSDRPSEWTTPSRLHHLVAKAPLSVCGPCGWYLTIPISNNRSSRINLEAEQDVIRNKIKLYP